MSRILETRAITIFCKSIFWANSPFPQTQPLAVFWPGSSFGFCFSSCCFACVFCFPGKVGFQAMLFPLFVFVQAVSNRTLRPFGLTFPASVFTKFLSGTPAWLRCLSFFENWLVSRASLLSGFTLSNFKVHFPASVRAFSASSFLGLIFCPTRRAGGRFATFRFAAFFSLENYFPFRQSVLVATRPLTQTVGLHLTG